MILRQALTPIVDFAFPPRCPCCGGEVIGSMSDFDERLCGTCWPKLGLPGQPACRLCQIPLASDESTPEQLCSRCALQAPLHDGIAAASIYGAVSRELLLALKHGGKFAQAGPMGRFMALRFSAAAIAEPVDPLVIPVPLHFTRMWKRGYNQSALLAKAFAAQKRWDLAPDALRRIRKTPSLDGLGSAERREALEGAIIVSPKARFDIEGRDIVLVDDVVTSGATTDACVAALKNAGAARVVIACYARVPLERMAVTLEADHESP